MKSSIVKNYIYNIGYQMLVLFLPLITTPYISRILGAEGIGAFGYTESISQYFVLFGCIGLNLYGQREIAYCQGDKEARSKVFIELLIVRVITVSIALIIFALTVCQSIKYGFLFKIQIIEIFATMVDISWYFQGLEEFKKIVVRNTIVKIVGVILIFTLIHAKTDLFKYALIYTVTLFVGNVSMWLYAPKYVKKVEAYKLNCIRHIKPALLLFIPQIATNMYNLLDKSMIGFLTKNDAEVAYYEQAQKIMKMALSIPTSLGTVMLPRMANMFGEGKNNEIIDYLKKSMRIIFLLTCPICVGVMVIAKGFVPWFFGIGYDKVVSNLLVIAPIIIIVGISNVIGVQYLLPVGRQKEYTTSVLIGTVVNFCLNIILIPRFFSIGAAFASIIAEFSVTVFQIIVVRENFNIYNNMKNFIKYLFASLIMGICCMWIYLCDFTGIIGTAFQICTGILVYLFILFVLKDDMIVSFMRRRKE